jgi:trk system potassium uptake protein
MNIKAISRNVGVALLVSALFMFLSVLVSIANGNDSALTALLISFTITFIVGIFPFIFVRKSPAITLRDGYMIIVLSWLLSFIFGMLPYVLWGGPFTVANAWFESVSGYTTTGATILDNVELLPDSLLFWRSSTHFIGGLGVVVFLLLIIPNSSPVRLRLTNMELSSLSREGYSTHANKIVKMFAMVYLLMNAAAFLAYWAAGMTPFEAVNHAFSVCASGGFSTRATSIASFDSRWIEGISMFFMLLTSLHFGMIYLAFATRSLKPLKSPVLKFYLLSLLIFTLVLTCLLRLDGCAESWGKSLWTSAFQVISTASTTGFSLTDNAHWPVTAGIVLLFAGLMCGCAGSTSGGVKADRVLVFFKAVQHRVLQVIHPSSVTDVKLGEHVIKQEELLTQMLYLTLYCLLVTLSVFISLLLGVDSLNSFAASVMSMGNVGPALGDLGNMGSFNSISAGAKFLYSMDMFFGRIEIYPALAVLAMIFSRKAK